MTLVVFISELKVLSKVVQAQVPLVVNICLYNL